MKTHNPNVFGFNLGCYPDLGQRFRDKCYQRNRNMVEVIAELLEKWIAEPEPPEKSYLDILHDKMNKV